MADELREAARRALRYSSVIREGDDYVLGDPDGYHVRTNDPGVVATLLGLAYNPRKWDVMGVSRGDRVIRHLVNMDDGESYETEVLC